MGEEYYDGMAKWISRHCIREQYGTYHIDGQLFDGFRVILLPNGFDMMPVFHEVKHQFPDTEKEEHFWKEEVTDSLIGFENDFWADIVFDRFEDWQSRAIFRTEDGVIHVRFEMQHPMDGPAFLDWVKSLGDRVDLVAGPRGHLYSIPFYGGDCARDTYREPPYTGGYAQLGRHDCNIEKMDRDDRYGTSSYSECDEWCDYLDEVMRRD